jgi:HAD superfamily hydrolase (TIGR01509 family)
VTEWSELLRQRFDLAQLVSSWIISGDVRSRKPNSAIFEQALRSLGMPGSSVLFLDDRAPNVEGARRAGFCAELFTNLESARRLVLRELAHENLL